MTKHSDLPYLNAINTFTQGKIGALEHIYDKFKGDWKSAWQNNLLAFAPKTDTLVPQRKLSPQQLWRPIEKERINIITRHDGAFPKSLLTIHELPFLLYCRGSSEVWRNDCLAIVGTRRLTEYGKRAARQITQGLAGSGLTIVSGLAFGADTIALETAVECGLKTIAVLGGGVDDATLYPPSNLKLAHRIIETGGAIIGEYAPGQHATPFSFPHRNRLISGLSKATFVIEADIKSGSLITARFAGQQGKDLMAVPGPITSKTSEGTNYLIKQGAALITDADDILDALHISRARNPEDIKPANTSEASVLKALAQGPLSIDELAAATGLDLGTLNSTLIMMELSRKIKSTPSNKFSL